jgi:hypothetical protein
VISTPLSQRGRRIGRSCDRRPQPEGLDVLADVAGGEAADAVRAGFGAAPE